MLDRIRFAYAEMCYEVKSAGSMFVETFKTLRGWKTYGVLMILTWLIISLFNVHIDIYVMNEYLLGGWDNETRAVIELAVKKEYK